jgi:hypothetical protein
MYVAELGDDRSWSQLLLAGSTLDMNNLFVFSLGGSLHDMWTAGAYFLAVLIGTFSGAWPYLKLLVIGYCWCTPLERCDATHYQALQHWFACGHRVLSNLCASFASEGPSPCDSAVRSL